jgi:hypothetical protein
MIATLIMMVVTLVLHSMHAVVKLKAPCHNATIKMLPPVPLYSRGSNCYQPPGRFHPPFAHPLEEALQPGFASG